MKVSVLNLLLGKAEIPEGFPVAFSLRFQPDQSGITANDQYFQSQIDPDYYFFLERIGISYPYQPSLFGSSANIPTAEIYRDKGERPYQNESIPLRLIATPGETLDLSGSTVFSAFVTGLKSGIAPNSFWPPGSVFKMKISGFTIDSSGETAQVIEVIAFGRYLFREDYRAKGGALT